MTNAHRELQRRSVAVERVDRPVPRLIVKRAVLIDRVEEDVRVDSTSGLPLPQQVQRICDVGDVDPQAQLARASHERLLVRLGQHAPPNQLVHRLGQPAASSAAGLRPPARCRCPTPPSCACNYLNTWMRRDLHVNAPDSRQDQFLVTRLRAKKPRLAGRSASRRIR